MNLVKNINYLLFATTTNFTFQNFDKLKQMNKRILSRATVYKIKVVYHFYTNSKILIQYLISQEDFTGILNILVAKALGH